jgi:hypothetical protein
MKKVAGVRYGLNHVGLGLPNDGKLSATLPRLSCLVHIRFIQTLPGDPPTKQKNQIQTGKRAKTGVAFRTLPINLSTIFA